VRAGGEREAAAEDERARPAARASAASAEPERSNGASFVTHRRTQAPFSLSYFKRAHAHALVSLPPTLRPHPYRARASKAASLESYFLPLVCSAAHRSRARACLLPPFFSRRTHPVPSAQSSRPSPPPPCAHAVRARAAPPPPLVSNRPRRAAPRPPAPTPRLTPSPSPPTALPWRPNTQRSSRMRCGRSTSASW
jgi:hypothetical protein